VVNATSSDPLQFGDGSDGVLDSSSGYLFNTDAHPNGFNFISVNITGGTIQVQGSKPLVIRSLSTISITPTLSVRGGDGQSGVANGSTTAPTGGTAVASLCSGGAGGIPANTPTGDGQYGLTYDSTIDSAAPPGQGVSGATSVSVQASGPFDFPSTPFETGSNFRCGAGGAGGGGQLNGGNHATGGAGGAGGGTIRLIAVGNITYGNLDASGGDGGAGVSDGFSSGSGSGGNGGAVWLQTLQTVSGPAPNVNGGNSPNNPSSAAGGAGFAGATQTDDTTTTTNVVPSQSYSVQSLSYDLGTKNAGFFQAPTIDTTLNGGTISVTYSGSTDGSHFSSSTSDITTLTNQGYRYIKFGISIQTPSIAGPSPQVNSISIPFAELNIQLAGGCGTLQRSDRKNHPGESTVTQTGLATTLLWLLLWCFSFAIHRKKKLLSTDSFSRRAHGISRCISTLENEAVD
jgi:hypothetical protein